MPFSLQDYIVAQNTKGCSAQKFFIKEESLSFKMMHSVIIYNKYYWRYGYGNVVWLICMKISKWTIIIY